jgi:hypothetical protein
MSSDDVLQQSTNQSGDNFMKTTFIGIAAIAVLSLLALPAHANCAYSGAGTHLQMQLPSHHFGNHEGIVGTWQVTYPNGSAFIQWHSDGTEWENINFPVLGGNICMGSWVATGPWTYSRNHYGWIFTGGLVTGYFNETETDTLSRDGNSYSGTNVSIFFDLGGHMVPAPGDPSPTPPPGGYPGTSYAVRIAP